MNVSFAIKQDRRNYIVWHEQILSLILAYDFEDYVYEVYTQPSKYLVDSQTMNPKFSKWNLEEFDLLFGIIVNYNTHY